MKQELEQIREQLLTLLNKLDELIEGEGGGLVSGHDIKTCLEREEKQVQRARPIDPPPPDKPKHP